MWANFIISPFNFRYLIFFYVNSKNLIQLHWAKWGNFQRVVNCLKMLGYEYPMFVLFYSKLPAITGVLFYLSLEASALLNLFLTRLVQNLTLRKDCNLIPSVHGTQHLSSQSNHWTKCSLHQGFLFKGLFQRGKVRVEDAQLSLRVVAGT